MVLGSPNTFGSDGAMRNPTAQTKSAEAAQRFFRAGWVDGFGRRISIFSFGTLEFAAMGRRKLAARIARADGDRALQIAQA
jgi:hypothetical protein